VEIVGGRRRPRRPSTAPARLDAIGMKGVVIGREIEAFVGDRLLEALWASAVADQGRYLDVETLDNVIRWFLWPALGPDGSVSDLPYRGRRSRMRHFLAPVCPCLKWPLTKLTDVVDLDDDLIEKIATQSDSSRRPVDPRARADPR